jgi:acetyl-CoA synthetase
MFGKKMNTEDKFKSLLNERRVFNPDKFFSKKARISSMLEYKKIYDFSVKNPEKFWAKQAEDLHWFKRWKSVMKKKGDFYKWFTDGKINVSHNCLDKNIDEGRGNKVAIIWEPEKGKKQMYTYSQLLQEVSRFSNVLKKNKIGKGDRVCIYMPMIPELAIAMLACARVGAIHSIVFGGFSSDSLKDRINDCEAKLVITSDGSFRNQKIIPLKKNVDIALKDCPVVKKVIVAKRCGNQISMKKHRDTYWHDEMLMQHKNDECRSEEMDSEDPLFILYTSGTTGKPKGVMHSQAGYLLYAHQTFKWVFDYKENDVYWCTADIGWITGHSYIIYGPLSNGATTIMYEGGPTYPDPGRFWDIVEKYKVTIFYTAPTAIRALMRFGDSFPKSYNLKSLRLLGSVGEAINPEAWVWYHELIGNKHCPIVDTWWQTETGGILITPLPGATPLKPGSATLPFPGIVPDILKEDGSRAGEDEGGYLVIRKPWPGMLRTVWKNPERYKETYFGKFNGIYLAGDSARRDKDGYYWILGRLDDVIKVSGHRLGTAELESHIVSHKSVAEAAVVPIPDKIKGSDIYAFVTLKKRYKPSDKLKKEIISHVSVHMGAIAKPSKIQFADELPKTRSGKIMRRILKSIAAGTKEYGNIATLADPSVVKKLERARVD